MKRTILVLVLGFLMTLGALPAAAAPGSGMAPLHRATGEAVDGQYIVVLKEGRSPAAVAERAGVQMKAAFEHALDGFAAELTDKQLERVRRHPHVDYVEEDQVAELVATQWNPPWGLDRIDQRYLPLSSSYTYNTTASNVDIYVVDTGIETSHWDFGGRAYRGFDAFGGTSEDCNGHGTHVAGTAGGSTYGVAKGAALWSVRVLDCSGSGTYSGIISGTNWVASHAASRPSRPAVANFSLGGGYSSALNNAVNNLANSGVFVAVAAGNNGGNACNISPASASNAFTVAASDSNDTRPWWSNYGGCVNLYAPGVGITSAWIGGGTNTIDGTSMASPHAAGVAALYKAYGDAHWTTVRNWLESNATTNVISNNPAGTPNRLLYKSSL